MHRRSALAHVEGLEPRTLLTRAVGIDIADYQHPNGAAINWTSVYGAGVQFAYIKATQANNYINTYFANDAANATAASIVVGAYDFADYTVDATTEANHFLSTARSYVGAGFMRPMLDVEIATSDTASQVSTWVNTWCNDIYQDTGVKPIVYTYISYASSYLNSTVTQWPLWMSNPNGQSAQTGGPNATAPWSSWAIWQYSTSSTVSGISATTDMDVANGDMTTYVIPQLVGGSSQFTTGQIVYVNNAPSGLKAYSTYTSNGSYVTEPNGTSGKIQGNPVYINGYLRWPVIYSGSTSVTWSAGAYLAGDVPSVTSFSGSPNPVTAGTNLTLTANVSDPASTVSSVLFYRESDGTAGLQNSRGGDTLLGYGTSNGAGGWTISAPTTGLSGSQTYYAVATNAAGTSSAAASTAVTVRALPAVTLTGGPNPATTDQPLSFTATVSGGVPDGETVTLEDTTNNNATVATGTLSGGSATFALPAGALSIGTHNLIALYAGDANFAPNQSAADAQTVQAPPPTISGAPVINGDNPNGLFNAPGQTTPGTQRSMVEDIVYTFSEPVTINDANQAFTLAVAGPAGGTLPSTLYAQAVANSNGTQWAVSLTGMPEGTIGSIANGEYSITINPAYVFAAADGVTSMAPGTGRTDTFYRLYGDVFGTESVTNADYNLFKKSINTYNPAFDDFGTGASSSNADYNVFKKDLNVSYYGDGFVTTI